MSKRLHPRSFKGKHDVIDWNGLPATAKECDLNYRPLRTKHTRAMSRTVMVLGGTALLAGLFWAACRFLLGAHLGTPEAFSTSCVAGILLAAMVAAGIYRPLPFTTARGKKHAVIATALFPPGLCLLAGSLFYSTGQVSGYSILLFAAIPLMAIASHQLGRHYLYWMSANPRIPHKTMLAWRRVWSCHFENLSPKTEPEDLGTTPDEMMKALRGVFIHGILWATCALALPPVLLSGLAVRGIVEYSGVAVVASQLGFLVLVLLIRDRTTLRHSFKVFSDGIEHWASWSRDRLTPPWVFQSPVGPQSLRIAILALGVFLLGLGVTLTIGTPVEVPVNHVEQTLHERWLSVESEWLMPTLIAIGNGNFSLVGSFAFWLLATMVLPLVMFFLFGLAAVGRVLGVLHIYLEQKGAPEQNSEWTPFDGYTDRLQNSGNLVEKNSILLGVHPDKNFPVLLDKKLLFEHKLILGATGSGKTGLGATSDVIQLIRSGTGPVIITDLKGDPALFHTARKEAEKAGRKFKHFTTVPGKSTFVFNPFLQDHLKQLTLTDLISLFMQSLNLNHGTDYGRAFFTLMSWATFRAAVKENAADTPAEPFFDSFQTAEEVLRRVLSSEEEFKHGVHLVYLIQALSEFEQLNVSPARNPDHPALKNAIHMPEVIAEKQVVYFYLVGAVDSGIMGEIARLVLYSALMAAIAHRDKTGKSPNMAFIADEAQLLVARNIENVLAQARSYGVGCIFSNQTLSQYNPPGGVDLREIVLSCTCTKQIFTCRDPAEKKMLSEMSGQTGYYSASWTQGFDDVARGRVGQRFAVGPDGEPLFGIREEIGPRMEAEDIDDISRHPQKSLAMIQRNEGYSQFIGAFPIRTDWPMSVEEHEHRSYDEEWPDSSDDTIQPDTHWPSGSSSTVIAKPHKVVNEPRTPRETTRFLQNFIDRATEEGGQS